MSALRSERLVHARGAGMGGGRKIDPHVHEHVLAAHYAARSQLPTLPLLYTLDNNIISLLP